MAIRKKSKIQIEEKPPVEEKATPEVQPEPTPELTPAPKAEAKPEPVKEETPAPKKDPVDLSLVAKKTIINPEFKSADAAMVDCRILQDINAVIGKKRWVFKAGTRAKVPGGVYEVFKQAKKAL